MARFLKENGPWKRLVALENIDIREVTPGRKFELTPSLSATAIRVPHRDEDSDTVAYVVSGPRRELLWLPDIDKWEKWDHSIERLVRERGLLAFVDGTFFSADEIPGRAIRDIPHPLVGETVAPVRNRAAGARAGFLRAPEPHEPSPVGRAGAEGRREKRLRNRRAGFAVPPLTP